MWVFLDVAWAFVQVAALPVLIVTGAVAGAIDTPYNFYKHVAEDNRRAKEAKERARKEFEKAPTTEEVDSDPKA